MSKLACPYCYRRINARRLWYQCTGRGTPGRPGCAVQRDARRQEQTGYADASRPVFAPRTAAPVVPRQATCPTCGGMTGIRVCPNCHTPLSTNFGDAGSPLIAMIGAKGTGKTVYLTVLAHELRTGLRRRFGADVRLTGDAQGGFKSALQWLEQNVDTVFTQRQLFEETPAATAGRREPLVFEWRQERRLAGVLPQFRTSFLSFYDTAGEDLTNQSRAHDLAYLGAADALILLLDPFMLPQARDRIKLPPEAITSTESTIDVVGRITEQLRASHGTRSRGRIKQPLAVAFAKVDAFFEELTPDDPLLRSPPALPLYDETIGKATHEHIRALLTEWGGDDIDDHLRHNYRSYRYFAVSSLGAPPDYQQRRVESGGVRPHRVDEPLVWLLSRFGVVPAREQR
jgi:hypothetical protein